MANKCELSGRVTVLDRDVYVRDGILKAGTKVQVVSDPRQTSGADYVDVKVCKGDSEFKYAVPKDALDSYKRLDPGQEKMWSMARYLISNPESYRKPQPRPVGTWTTAHSYMKDVHLQPQAAGDLSLHEQTHQSTHDAGDTRDMATESLTGGSSVFSTLGHGTIFYVMVDLVDVCIGNDYRAACKSALTGWSKKSAEELYADVEESCVLKTEEDPGPICKLLFGNDLKFVKDEQTRRKESK